VKTSFIVIALAVLACLVVIGLRRDEPVAAGAPETARGPSFEVDVVKPRSAMPLFGILPPELFGIPAHVGFDQSSRGAEIGRVGRDRLELSADGWDLSIEIDGEGRVAPGTRLVFPLALGGKERVLRCRPGDPPVGYLRTTTRAGAGELSGAFLVKLATCENVETGKLIEWPPRALTLVGSFDRLPKGTLR